MRNDGIMRNGIRAAALCGLLFTTMVSVAATTTSVAAQSSIRVVVNGEPITSNEIATRARFLRLVDRTTTGASLERAARDELIEERLKFQEAKRVGLTVTQSEVDTAFANIAQRLKATPAQLAQGLGAQGISVDTLKTRLKAQIAWQQLVVGRFSKQIAISDSQIVDALAKKGETKTREDLASGTTAEYNLTQVVLIVRAKGGDPAARTREAEALRNRVEGCDGLVAATKPIPETLVKSLGKRTEDELPEAFRGELAKLPVGKLSKPNRGPLGIEMVMVCGKREVAGDFSIRSKVEQDLRNQEGEVYARRYMNDLKRIAVIDFKK